MAKIAILFTVFTLTIFNAQFLNAQNPDCKEVQKFKDQYYTDEDCLKEAGGAAKVEDIKKEDQPCYYKCVHVKRGMVDKDGKPMKDMIQNVVSTFQLPDTVKTNLAKKFEVCLDQNTSTLNMADCPTIGNFCTCIKKSFDDEPCQ